MRRLPLPEPVVMALALGSVVLLMTSGVRLGVNRKARTSYHGHEFIEDSLAGNQTRYRVITSSDETGGESFTIEILIREGALGSARDKPGSQPGHLHLFQDEHIEVKAGRLGYWRGDADKALEAGEKDDGVIIQQGEAHALWNAGGEGGGDLVLEVTFRPARRGEALYETLAGLGHEYETVLAVSPLQKLLTYSRAEVMLTSVPPALWRAMEEWLVPLAEGLGYKAFYPQYSTRTAAPIAEALLSSQNNDDY
ncbi:MAG: hypothetical protein J3K34DRAFT_251797 [Monoraphidium minutum]|nr:MAG: hypothetical protein J3K34DRAFT_251797 [Monoraphidium minutum]